MLDQHHGHPRRPPGFAEDAGQPGGVVGIEARGRLVEHQQPGPAHHGPPEFDQSGVPEVEGVDGPAGQVGDAEQIEYRFDMVELVRGRPAPVDEVAPDPDRPAVGLLGHQQVVGHRHPLEELHPLERAADAQAAALPHRQPVDAPTVEGDGAGVGFLQPEQAVEQRRLAGAVGPDHADGLARGDVHVDMVEGHDAAELLGDAFGHQQRSAGRARHPAPPTAGRGSGTDRSPTPDGARSGPRRAAAQAPVAPLGQQPLRPTAQDVEEALGVAGVAERGQAEEHGDQAGEPGGQRGDRHLEGGVDHPGHHRPGDGPEADDGHHHQEHGRDLVAEVVGRQRALQRAEEGATHPGQGGRQGEHQDPQAVDVDAHRVGGQLAAPHGGQIAAHGPVAHQLHHAGRRGQDHQRQQEERLGGGEADRTRRRAGGR